MSVNWFNKNVSAIENAISYINEIKHLRLHEETFHTKRVGYEIQIFG